MSTAVSHDSPLHQAASLHDSAASCHAAGNDRRAESLCLRALQLIEQHKGPGHPDVAAVLGTLGDVYRGLGRYAEAERSFQRALRIAEKTLGPEHPEVATLYHNLGGLEHARGRFARGEPLARRSVEIRQKALGPDQPDVARTWPRWPAC